MVSYPRDPSSSSTQSDQYAPVIVPCDLIHVRVGVSPPPGIIVTVHALPPQFPLAITYIETLASQKYNFEHRHAESDSRGNETEASSSGSTQVDSALGLKEQGPTSPWRNFETVVIPPPVLLHVTELLGGCLWRTQMPAVVKEHVFHLLAQCLRMVHHSEKATTSGAGSSTLSPQLSPSLALLMQLQSELRKLYDEETKSWSTASTASGTGMGLGVGDTGRFSTYFQSLMEVSLAVAEVTAPITPSSLTSLTSLETSSPTSMSTPPVPTSPMSVGKRKKLKAKRERERGTTTPKRSGSPRRLSESDQTASTSPPTSASSSATSVSSSSSSSSNVALSSTKPEDMLWFHRALTMSQILRYITAGDVQGQGVTNDAIADAAHALMTPTAHSRLLVITGIPTHLEESVVAMAIRKACNANGGLFKDELYLPIEQIQIQVDQVPAEPAQPADNTQTDKPPAQPAPAVSEKPKQQPQVNLSKTVIKGFAVIELRSRTKVEAVKKALLRSKTVIDGMTLDPDNPGDIPEEMMSVSLVNQSLITEPQNNANTVLEDYLLSKLTSSKETLELNDAVMIALTEIFHSCFISEQRMSFVESRQESGYICLGRDQIMLQVAGNLLFPFLTAVRAAKKTLSEQVSYILRRYGIPKMMDKEE